MFSFFYLLTIYNWIYRYDTQIWPPPPCVSNHHQNTTTRTDTGSRRVLTRLEPVLHILIATKREDGDGEEEEDKDGRIRARDASRAHGMFFFSFFIYFTNYLLTMIQVRSLPPRYIQTATRTGRQGQRGGGTRTDTGSRRVSSPWYVFFSFFIYITLLIITYQIYYDRPPQPNDERPPPVQRRARTHEDKDGGRAQGREKHGFETRFDASRARYVLFLFFSFIVLILIYKLCTARANSFHHPT